MHSFLSKKPTEIVQERLRSKHGRESSAMWPMLLNSATQKSNSALRKRERKIMWKKLGSTIVNGNTD